MEKSKFSVIVMERVEAGEPDSRVTSSWSRNARRAPISALIRRTGRGIAHTRPAFAYLFQLLTTCKNIVDPFLSALAPASTMC